MNDLTLSESLVYLGHVIRERRKLSGLGTGDLANIFKMSESYLGLIERGKRCPSLKNLHMFADFFELSYDDLLSGKKRELKKVRKKSRSTQKTEFLLRKLDDKQKEKVALFIKEFLLDKTSMNSREKRADKKTAQVIGLDS